MHNRSIIARLFALGVAAGVLAACGGGSSARSTATDKANTTVARSTAPPMSEGSPLAAPTGEMQPQNGTPPQPIPSGLNCSASEIVWVNESRHVYHYAGDTYYGRTKHGTYKCERDAVAEHDRPAGKRTKSNKKTSNSY